MPLKYKVLAEHRLLVGVFAGALTPEEYVNGIDELSRNPAFAPDYDRLGFLHDDLDLSLFGLRELRAIKDRMSAAYFGGRPPSRNERLSYRIAVVSRPSINETMLKLYAATLTASLLSTVSADVFPDVGKALSWLGRGHLTQEFTGDDWIRFVREGPGS